MSLESRLPASILMSLLSLGLAAGCDKVGSLLGDEDEKEAARTDEAEPSDDKTDEVSPEPSVDPKDDEIAALEAELKAAKEREAVAKQLDPDAAEQLDEPIEPEDEVGPEQEHKPGQDGPVTVASVALKRQPSPAGGSYLRLSADFTVNEKKDGGIYAKAACSVGDEVFVNVTTLSHSSHGELGKMNEGDTENFSSTLFFSGLPGEPSRCQLAFDYGAPTFSTRLSDFCWDGSKVSEGDCEEPVEAKPKGEGAVVPFGFTVSPGKPIGRNQGEDATSVDVRFAVRINDELDRAPHLHTKTACRVGAKTWVEVLPSFPHVKPFKFHHGEAVPLGHGHFLLSALPGKPEACNIEVLLDGGFDKDNEQITEVCWNGTQVSDGACEFRSMVASEAAPLASDSIAIEDVTHEWVADWQDKSKVTLALSFAATVHRPIEQRVMLKGSATCDGKSDGEHLIGTDFKLIGAGETVGLRMVALRNPSLPKPAKSCQISFTASPMGFREGGEQVEVASFCLRGDKVSGGNCKGGSKSKTASKTASKKKAADKPTPKTLPKGVKLPRK
jgi:hypothetical protein